MNFTVLFCLLSLSFLSAQSLSAPSPAPASSKAPVEAMCDFFEEQVRDDSYSYCIGTFDSYPTIRNATSKGVAIIANNIAKQRLNTFITNIKTYLSTSPPDELEYQSLGTCIDILRSDINQSLPNAMRLIMKGEYRTAFDGGKSFFDKIISACNFRQMPPQILPSAREFMLTESVAYVAIAFVGGL